MLYAAGDQVEYVLMILTHDPRDIYTAGAACCGRRSQWATNRSASFVTRTLANQSDADRFP